MTRVIVLDTATTGIRHRMGHPVIGIGAVELIGGQVTGRRFHAYLQPRRVVDRGAQRVHGIGGAMLAGKLPFASKAAELLDFPGGSEVGVHNAGFDRQRTAAGRHHRWLGPALPGDLQPRAVPHKCGMHGAPHR